MRYRAQERERRRGMRERRARRAVLILAPRRAGPHFDTGHTSIARCLSTARARRASPLLQVRATSNLHNTAVTRAEKGGEGTGGVVVEELDVTRSTDQVKVDEAARRSSTRTRKVSGRVASSRLDSGRMDLCSARSRARRAKVRSGRCWMASSSFAPIHDFLYLFAAL